jgi:hypothetical protein
MPLLLLHGTDDKLTQPAGSRELALRAPSPDITLHIYDGAWHVLLDEPHGVGAQVERDLLAWLDAHTGGPPIVAPPIDVTRPLAGDRADRFASSFAGAGIVRTAGATHATTELTVRRAAFAPLGWAGSAWVRYTTTYGIDAGLLPVGLSSRAGRLGMGIATGIGMIGPDKHVTAPISMWLELPAGPVHVSAYAQLDYRLHGNPDRDGWLNEDRGWYGVAIRVPGDRAYWPPVLAGFGPYLNVGAVTLEHTTAFQASIGLSLFGSD